MSFVPRVFHRFFYLPISNQSNLNTMRKQWGQHKESLKVLCSVLDHGQLFKKKGGLNSDCSPPSSPSLPLLSFVVGLLSFWLPFDKFQDLVLPGSTCIKCSCSMCVYVKSGLWCYICYLTFGVVVLRCYGYSLLLLEYSVSLVITVWRHWTTLSTWN